MDAVLLAPLNQIETSLNALLTSLTTTNTYTAAPSAAQSLLDADDALSSALGQLRKHQENYARILALRAEATRLHTQLRDIVRTCVDLRSEIGQIHPSILEDTDDEDDEVSEKNVSGKQGRQAKPVDYHTLLGFASRIGKHNAAAAIEAERQSNRRKDDDSKTKAPEPNGSGNGTQTQQGAESAIEDEPAGNNTTATQESLAELAAINDTLAQQRAYRGMAFPAAEALRLGALGRLQYLREQEGEDAVERELERIVRETERVTAVPAEPEKEQRPKEAATTTPKTENVPAPAQRERPAPETQAAAPQQRQPPLQHALPPKPKKALDLDFPSSDDDDDD